jgi:serine/threonine protein kinase
MNPNQDPTVVAGSGSGNAPEPESTADAATVVLPAGSTQMSSGQATSILPGAAASTSRSALPSVGDLLGPYVIDSKLGEGGMGCVYLTHHRENQDEIRAIKVISPEMANDSFFVETFVREARVLSRMTGHDALVKYFFFDRRADGLVYIVMEFVGGVSLGERLNKKGKLTPAEVRALMTRCAEGLSTLHQRKIIHRDLKPDNIILPDGLPEQAKIVDFGIAKASELGKTVVEQGGFVGTPHYASPEQLYGRLIDERSDIYSLGLVLAHAATGKSLRAGLAPHEILKASEALPDLSAVPRELRDDLTRMLQPDPRNRPASMDELLGAKPGGGGPKRGLMIGGGAVAALLVAGGIAAVMLSKPSTSNNKPAVATTAEAAKTGPTATAASGPAEPSEPAKTTTPSPATTPSPSLESIAAGLTTQLSQFDCATLIAKPEDGKIALDGFVQSESDKSRATAQAEQASGRPVVSRLQVLQFPFCAVKQLATTFPSQGDIQILPSHVDRQFRIGDLIALTVTPPRGVTHGWLTVELIDAEGNIGQQLPVAGSTAPGSDGLFNSGDPIRVGFPGSPSTVTAEDPPGPMMMLAIYSEKRLQVAPKDGEAIRAYLPRLRDAVAAAGGSTSADTVMIDVVKARTSQ